jgi:serine/threonine protein kinase
MDSSHDGKTQPPLEEAVSAQADSKAQTKRRMTADIFTRTLIGVGEGTEFKVPIIERKDNSPVQQYRQVIPSTGNSYMLEKLLGVGGMGEVWIAQRESEGAPGPHDNVSKPVAIKFVTGVDLDQHLRQSFVKEAQLIANLEHDNIVGFQSWEYIPESDAYFIVMDYVEGMDVDGLKEIHNLHLVSQAFNNADLLKKDVRQEIRNSKALRIPDQVAGFVTWAVSCALEYAHDPKIGGKAIIHRDISPGNILIKTDEGVVKLSDFGIAAEMNELQGKGGVAAGKISYIAPETIMGRKIDERTDLYSLGVVLYEMLTGIRPNDCCNPPTTLKGKVEKLLETYEKPVVPPHEIVKDINPELSKIAYHLVQTDPDRRYANAADLRVALEICMYKKGRGINRFGLRDYIAFRQGKLELTGRALKNLSFLKQDPVAKLKHWLECPSWTDESARAACCEYRLSFPYVLTEYAISRLEKWENPARK